MVTISDGVAALERTRPDCAVAVVAYLGEAQKETKPLAVAGVMETKVAIVAAVVSSNQ